MLRERFLGPEIFFNPQLYTRGASGERLRAWLDLWGLVSPEGRLYLEPPAALLGCRMLAAWQPTHPNPPAMQAGHTAA